MAMYDGALTVVRTLDGNSDSFEVKIGLHQGSVLSPSLLIIVKDVVSREVLGELPWNTVEASVCR